MISAGQLAAFAAASFVLIIIPGPSVLFVVGRALAHGRRTALMTVVGGTLGAYTLVVAVALGLGSVVERSATVFWTLKLVGAAYLMYLGFKAWRSRGALREAFSTGGSVGHGALRTAWEGYTVGVTNPKTIVFFAAVLPQFVDRGQGHVAVQMLLLGLIFCAIGIVSDMVWGLAAAGARDWFANSPRRTSMVGGAGGLSMIALGVTIAVTGRE
ncbi:LysE family translocator [Yinghuangia seranimata]|uniref:LysE family translocator n=1 Tax=Yinghuangia seranimata TaxID=408067 RepID=UPI00248D0427|nr:LysE family translocator [Yinghuangia seranimata]MDI2132181.1 LysE family translocator [Yinghuangia seranimata]